jgi:penicillin-binding protein-related factor A (putative recombinase)
VATEIWRQFEKRCKEDLQLGGHAVTHVPSHLQQTKYGSVRKKTDCDFAAGINGRAVFFDAKVCGEARFNIKSLILRPDKIHQYWFLIGAVEKGSVGGYLIWFYDKKKIVWLPAENIHRLTQDSEKSIGIDSPEVRTQDDDKPIRLDQLIWGIL